MPTARSIYMFGHSFPAKLAEVAQQRGQSVACLLRISDWCTIKVEGHPGLTYTRILDNLEDFCRGMRILKRIDLLCLDMGTNDLCCADATPSVVVERALRFLQELGERDIRPHNVVFLTVIERSQMTGCDQVRVKTFNNRIKRFNKLLNNTLATQHPEMCLHMQRKVNQPRHLAEDGFHLTAEGMEKYIRQLKYLFLRYRYQ